MMPDTAPHTAFSPDAPLAERTEALAELQKSYAPKHLSDLFLPPDDIRPVIDWIIDDLEDQSLNKSIRSGIVPFPSANAGRPGMQSVRIDDFQLAINGDYLEKPGVLGFDSFRQIVDQTPVLSAIIFTRVRQVQRFCRLNDSGDGPGFAVRHIDRNHKINGDDRNAIAVLSRFFTHCGMESSPRMRKRLKRDGFSGFMAKLVRDSLTLDSAPIELEHRRDKRLGIDGMYAVDGATIRLCTEQGYHGGDEIFALQVVQGRVRTAYSYDDLIYEARNPRSDILSAGYGLSEVELMIRVVTGFLNAMTYNIKGFDSNSIPKGVLSLVGEYTERDLAAFRRHWTAMVSGVANQWKMPVLTARDPESKATFQKFGVEFNEMYFSKWMTFLVSILCAIYSISPDEINFESFSANRSALSGSDTEEKLVSSKDKGLIPLLAHFENTFSEYIVPSFSDQYVFRWTGLDDQERAQRHEIDKSAMTWNEARTVAGRAPVEGEIGDVPLNPALIDPWMRAQGIGQPGGGQENGSEDEPEPMGKALPTEPTVIHRITV